MISLTPVLPSDVADLVEVHTAAFEPDRFSNLMLLNRAQDAHQAMMRKSIDFWMSDPTATLVKAVDSDTGNVMGWACCVTKEQAEPSTTSKEPEVAGEAPAPVAAQPLNKQSNSVDPSRALGGVMHRDLMRWEKECMAADARYLVLQALVTSPVHQRKGVGSLLIRWAVERADAQGIRSWVHASPASCALYERNGFKVIGKNDYNLGGWVSGTRKGDDEWGMYTFTYLVRDPVERA